MQPLSSRNAWSSPFLLHGLGALGALSWGMLAWRSRQDEPIALSHYFTLMGAAWLVLVGSWFASARLEERELRRALWLWAVVYLLIGFAGRPIYEDDWARYLWDGRMFALTGNPYASAPMAHFHDASVPDAFQRVLDEVNNPNLPTVYPPVCQFVFALGYFIAPAALWPLKLIFIAALLALMGLVLRFAGPRHALLFGWCPLLIQETAFTAHPDVLWVLFTIAALSLSAKGYRPIQTAAYCGLAIASKIFAIILVPFILVRLERRYWPITALTIMGCYLPFWLQHSTADLASMKAMAGGWEFNSLVHAPLASFIGDAMARAVCLSAFALLWGGVFFAWCQRGTAPRCDVLMGAFFLTTNVVNPWYLIGLAPFVALRPSLWGMAALAVVSLSYAHGLTLPDAGLGPYQLAAWVKPLEAGILLVAGLGTVMKCRRSPNAERITSR